MKPANQILTGFLIIFALLFVEMSLLAPQVVESILVVIVGLALIWVLGNAWLPIKERKG